MKQIIFERHTLYNEVWREPMTAVAKRHGISDVAVHKICDKLNIPLPGGWYCAKQRAGAKVKKPPLPKSIGPQKYVFQRPDDVERSSRPPSAGDSGIGIYGRLHDPEGVYSTVATPPIAAGSAFETRPGEQAQVDFGSRAYRLPDGAVRQNWVFTMVSSWSRTIYVYALPFDFRPSRPGS